MDKTYKFCFSIRNLYDFECPGFTFYTPVITDFMDQKQVIKNLKLSYAQFLLHILCLVLYRYTYHRIIIQMASKPKTIVKK